MPPISDVVDVLPKVKAMALADRAAFERGMKAFVSYVQAYAKHECSLIFRVKGDAGNGIEMVAAAGQTCNLLVLIWTDLDFAALARGFGLLRLPKMPELRGKTFPDFPEAAVDTDAIPYKDKNREKQRQKTLAEQKDRDGPAPPKKNFAKNKAWSKQKSKKERRKRRAVKRKHEEVSADGWRPPLRGPMV